MTSKKTDGQLLKIGIRAIGIFLKSKTITPIIIDYFLASRETLTQYEWTIILMSRKGLAPKRGLYLHARHNHT
jgi:hypothetical protein